MAERERPRPSSRAPADKRRGSPPAFSRVRRLRERGAYDRETIYAILDAATHCHVAHVIDGQPVATPTLHWRHEDRL